MTKLHRAEFLTAENLDLLICFDANLTMTNSILWDSEIDELNARYLLIVLGS